MYVAKNTITLKKEITAPLTSVAVLEGLGDNFDIKAVTCDKGTVNLEEIVSFSNKTPSGFDINVPSEFIGATLILTIYIF